VLAAILAVCAVLAFIGINHRWFAKNYYYKTEFESAANVSPGTSIYFKGFQVGSIARTRLNKHNAVDVDFYIFDSYYDRVTENSLIQLNVNPIGLGSQLVLVQGKSLKQLPERSFIPRIDSEEGKRRVSMSLVDVPLKDDTIAQIIGSINPLIRNFSDMATGIGAAVNGTGTGSLADALRSARGAFGSLEKVSAAMNDKVPGILDDLSVTMNSVKDISVKLEGISADVKQFSAALSEPTGLAQRLVDPKGSFKTLLDDQNALYNRITSLLNEVNSTLVNVNSISSRLNGEMPTLSSILSEGKTTLEKAQDVLEGLKNNPLLKEGIPQKANQSQLLDSLRDEEF
jgi:phospholipid/cholesterol/gamma-HCH transport system substrate-binding protein